MFVLKELENSDARCDCTTTNFADIKAAQKYMAEQFFEKLKTLPGGTYAEEESERLCPEEQRWANINSSSAHIQDGLDAYDWEICEDPSWVQKNDCPEGFIVTGCKTDNKNGELLPVIPVYAKTEDEAKDIMKMLYQAELENRGLMDNGACDEEGNSCPGGWMDGTGADIWDNAEYAFDCLVNVAHFSYYPIQTVAKEKAESGCQAGEKEK